MTHNEIIEMAKKCGWNNPANNMAPLYEFAKLVAQHERNEIIEILDASTGYVHMDAIRERGQV
jgi:hypothetical protein